MTAIIAISSVASMPITEIAYGYIVTKNEPKEEVHLAEKAGTEEIVRTYFKDIPVMIQVARCESRFIHTLSNGEILRGKVNPADTGVMQINRSYHADRAERFGLNLENIYDNMTYARILYEERGTQPWEASASCWSRTVATR